eukprot:GEZU01016230.1.p1 GENE.GEZU01016230.1~~GEZU01016230.1.p1  ORF type:complete len:185 (-),score=27.26 GEZU01016230.1:160-714(-)
MAHSLILSPYAPDPETGKLITRRLITAKSNIPSVIQPFVGKLNDFRCYMLEDTVIDPKTETLEMHTRTISYTNLMQVDEHVTYKGVPLDDGNDRTNKGTYYTQEANISVTLKGPGMGFISNKAEGIIHSSYYKNSNKGVALLERLCREISSPSSSSTTADEEITPSSSSSPATIVDHHQHAPAH